MSMTARGKMITEERPALDRAANAILRELAKRGIYINNSTGLILAIHACAAFKDIETPEPVKVENLKAAFAEAGIPWPAHTKGQRP